MLRSCHGDATDHPIPHFAGTINGNDDDDERRNSPGPGASPGKKCGVDTHGERVKHKPITESGAEPQQGPGAEPWSEGQGGDKPPLKVKTF